MNREPLDRPKRVKFSFFIVQEKKGYDLISSCHFHHYFPFSQYHHDHHHGHRHHHHNHHYSDCHPDRQRNHHLSRKKFFSNSQVDTKGKKKAEVRKLCSVFNVLLLLSFAVDSEPFFFSLHFTQSSNSATTFPPLNERAISLMSLSTLWLCVPHESPSPSKFSFQVLSRAKGKDAKRMPYSLCLKYSFIRFGKKLLDF